jgi:hypothetical protein
MADIEAGTEVRTLDAHLPAITNTDDTIIANFAVATGFTFETGSPEVGVFFIAPTSGRVMVIVGGGARDNSAGSRVFIGFEIRRIDGNGEVIQSPNDTRSYGVPSQEINFVYGCRIRFIESLTPGEQYYARVQHAVDVATDPDTHDISARDISVVPLP